MAEPVTGESLTAMEKAEMGTATSEMSLSGGNDMIPTASVSAPLPLRGRHFSMIGKRLILMARQPGGCGQIAYAYN